MNRTLAIILSFLIVLQLIVIELALAWTFADDYKTFTLDSTTLSIYIVFILTGIACLVFNIRFLFAMRSATKSRYFFKSYISKIVNICFAVSVFLWIATFFIGFYSIFIKADTQPDDYSSNRTTLIFFVFLILSNCYVWEFFAKAKKEFRNRITESEIDSIGEKLL